ncbi:MAG: hypothetical protein AAGB31_00925 [Bdellovibrio sp.]
MKILSAIFLLFLMSTSVYGKIVISTPQSGEWLPWLDEDRELEISGKVIDAPKVSEVTLTFKQRAEKNEVFKQKLTKDGDFHFKISQFLVYPDAQTMMTFSGIDKSGKEVEKTTLLIYCCSVEKTGFFQQLVSGRDYTIKVNILKSAIDNVEVMIPKKSIEENVDLFISVAAVERIDLKKYIPISRAVRIYFSKINTPVGLRYSIPTTLDTPRNDMAKPISEDDWNYITDKKWQPIDLKKSKVVILATNDGGVQWDEFHPDKVIGNNVTFTFSEKMRGNTVFVVAVTVDKK